MSADDYAIRQARVDERAALLDFLERHFFPREYLLTTYLKKNKYRIDHTEERIIANDLRIRHKAMIENLPCLVAVHQQTNKIVAINLMSVDRNPAFADASGTEQKSFADIVSSVPQQSKILADWFSYVLAASDESVDFFSEFPRLRSALKLIIICVDPDHSGRGLATKLVAEAVNYAQSKDIGLVGALFTSPFSRKAAEKNGLVKFHELNIASLCDEEGNVIYEGSQPYVISLMAKVLNEVS